MEVWWFSRVIAHHPFAILIAVFVLSSACLIVPLATNKFPDFSDPQLGFEARGTALAQRLTAWDNLIRAANVYGELIDNPIEYYNYLLQSTRSNSTETFNRTRTISGTVRKKPKHKKKKGKKYQSNLSNSTTDELNEETNDKWDELLKLTNSNRLEYVENHLSGDFFCNAPTSSYSRVVIGSETGENLWSLDGVLAQCHIDAMLRANPEFPLLCERRSTRGPAKKKCCRSWSPANYVAFLSNRTSCLGVTQNDLAKVESLLIRCVYYYRNRELTPDCAEDFNCQKQVPPECYAHNAPYHLLHYLLDTDSIPKHTGDNNTSITLKSAMLFLPIAASSATLNFYNELNSEGLRYRDFRVLGMELGLKRTLFDKLLVSDSCLLLSGFAFVTVCIWAYTSSIILTISTILAVIFSLGISYSIYTLIIRITFFPFMNLLAIIVAVGIGADDAFIFCKVWEQNKQQKLSNGRLITLVQNTMKHAVPSMFVTSLTTAVAFFASIVSNVTAINCFSLFSGMTVIANFFLMITWLPASVVVSERCRSVILLSPANFIVRKIIRPLKLTSNKIILGFSNILVQIVIKLRWFWLPILGAIALLSGMVVFSFPGLRLPDSQNFQLFDSSHLFERYDLIYARKFWFEKKELGEGEGLLPLRFVWGIKPVDTGDYLDPSSRGKLVWDDSFDISDPKSQIWLQNFCENLRIQSFHYKTLGPLLSNCFIDTFRTWMSRQCEDVIDPRVTREPCCASSTYPYRPEVLKKCLVEATNDLYLTPKNLWTRGGNVSGGLKYLKDSVRVPAANESESTMPIPKIVALVVEYDSTYTYSLSFAEMNEFYHKVESWMVKELRSAPKGMRNGWFVSDLEFYELQRTLYEGTIWAMGVSMILALIVLALVTLNPLVSLYAIITIGGAILVTVAALILLGWRLNVLESVAVSTAIGLAVDFSLHYGVSYRTCKSDKKIDRVKAALEQMGGPTLMAATTSGASGALMLPSHVLAYIQIAIFLLLVMAVSWIYATFFLCPLLAILGPSNNYAQFHYANFKKYLPFQGKRKKESTIDSDNDRVDWRRKKDKSAISESNLSTSSTVCQLHCAEIEVLTPRPVESLPILPSSPLLYLDSTQNDSSNKTAKPF